MTDTELENMIEELDTLTDAELNDAIDEMYRMFETIPNPEQEPKRFAAYVKLCRHLRPAKVAEPAELPAEEPLA
jgi:hypothetical protein